MREPAYLSRRALAALPIAALAATPAAALPAPFLAHPDAELLDLVAAFEAAEARREECDRQIDEAFDRFEPPAVPEALIWRKSDWPGISSDHPRTHLARYSIDGQCEYVYDSLDTLRSEWTGSQPPPFVYGKRRQEDCDRAAEIIASIGEWQAATKRAEDAAGYTELGEASEQAAVRCAELRRQIISARARTSEGMMAKVRAMILHFPDNPSWVQERLEEAVAAGGGADCANCFGMSLALDAMALAGGTPPIAKTRSGAA